MFGKLPLATLAATSLSLASSGLAQTAKKSLDPNEKVCETITPVGSRLATKKVCATRAEWADKRKQDREETEKAQRLSCLKQGACGGN